MAPEIVAYLKSPSDAAELGLEEVLARPHASVLEIRQRRALAAPLRSTPVGADRLGQAGVTVAAQERGQAGLDARPSNTKER